MTISTGSGFATQASQPICGTVGFVELHFQGETVRVTSWPVDLTALGYTWTGVGSVVSMPDLQESEDGVPRKATLKMNVADSSYLALALGGVDTYQGRDALIYIAPTDGSGAIQGDPILRFAGLMDKISIDPSDQNGAILLDCEAGSYDPRNNPTALRMNDAQHQSEHPGELGFQYVQDLIDHPTQWLSAKFQRI